MITKVYNKAVAGICCLLLLTFTPLLLTSCEDFFDQESENVIYSDQEHLTNWSDTVYSVTGILSKLQVIADRTILLGEVRGDLVTLTSAANSDLRDLAIFNAQSDNQYNQPRDYYAVINNCNYYIAHADTALKSNRNEYIFMKEYAAVKAIRAWTYLQLVLNYGSVPFVTEPILTKDESERDYPRYDLAAVCQWLLNDLTDIPERYDNEYPFYGDNVRSNDSRMFFFPLNIVRGDLYLYLASTQGAEGGKANYERAALCYFKYINGRNGLNTIYPTGIAMRMWRPGEVNWQSPSSYNGFLNAYYSETYSTNAELITMIPCDSIRAEGNYSELRNLFVSREDNDYKVSITPSDRIVELSEAQVNCCLSSNAQSASYAPTGLPRHQTGDLRLSAVWDDQSYLTDFTTGIRTQLQFLDKYSTRNVHIYRRQLVYLRLAEALNWAGYPRLAYKILETGLSDKLIKEEVYPYTSEADSIWISNNIVIPDDYEVLKAENFISNPTRQPTMVGIHSRGSGWTPYNEYYRLIDETEDGSVPLTDSTSVFDQARYDQIKARQQVFVDSLIINESALEFAFEGTRFYDLMRYCMRQQNPGAAMQEFILNRRGQANRDAVATELKKSLLQPANWYLNWNGRLGMQ